MSKHTWYILFLALLLQGCDFFYSTVEYQGKEADNRLCVISRAVPMDKPDDMLRVDVMHSAYFFNSGQQAMPVLKDALVTVQVNSAPARQAVFTPDSDTLYSMNDNGMMRRSILEGSYEVNLPFAGNDTLRLLVNHPQYGTATTMQVCPMRQEFTLQVDSISRYGEVWCHMHLPAYLGSMSDVLTLQTAVVTNESNDEGYNLCAYSRNEVFAQYENKQTRSGFYGGQQLHLSPDTTDRDVQLVLDARAGMWRSYDSSSVRQDTLLISAYVIARTQDDYQYKTSMRRVLGRTEYVPELSSQQPQDNSQGDYIDFNIEEIFDLIAESFDVLGNAESYQVHGNLQGTNSRGLQPFGCFSLVNPNKQTVEVYY